MVAEWLESDGGRIAYEVTGSGPLVVCVPGMGDLRSSFRYLVPDLAAAGYRVVTLDLRGHGDSDTTFTRHDDEALGGDIAALIRHLGGPATVVGNSMGAAGAAWAAAENPEAVSALVLIGPFVREVEVPAYKRWLLRLALLRPWGRAAWMAYYRSLFVTRRPDDFDEHAARIRASLGRADAWRAFVATTRSGHAAVGARLGDVTAPVLVVMGSKDPDFPDAAAEAAEVARLLRGQTVLVEGAGHYPHAERPDVVSPAIRDFLQTTASRA